MPSYDRLSQASCRVLAIRPSEQGRTLGLRESGWTYRRTGAHVETMYRLCVAALSSGLWNVPTQ